MLGQTLKGRLGLYTVTKQLQDSVWVARTCDNKQVVVKAVNHSRIHNERDVLRRFQHNSPFIRPLLDEIEEPSTPPAIVLKHVDDDLLNASDTQRLTRSEVKYVAKKVLEAISAFHEGGFVHTGKVPDDTLDIVPTLCAGEQQGSRFTDVQLADFGSTIHKDSSHARNGDPIGTPIFRSPEAHLQMRWSTSTDICFLYREGFHIFKPDVPVGHDDYELKIIVNHYRCFGPFPVSYEEIANEQKVAILIWIMKNTPAHALKPLHLTILREICQEDKQFVLRIMKLDPRDRPTAHQLLEDEWFHQS
ncbi:serine/threonine protein kinase [Trichophyton rubrum MR1459]|nr:serine/threonine protein kinase [Trichophyton rubrum MR1459]